MSVSHIGLQAIYKLRVVNFQLASSTIMRLNQLVSTVGLMSLVFAAHTAYGAPPKGSQQNAFGNKSAVVPVTKVSKLIPPVTVEFLRDIGPILDRNNCSTAACHGKFGGRGGFQISLLTLSPEDDFEPIVYGARGRRINFAEPEKSLMLTKSTGQIPHGGGPRFAVGSPDYTTLLNWIKQGAHFDDKDPRLVSLSITPAKVTLVRPVAAPAVISKQAAKTVKVSGKNGKTVAVTAKSVTKPAEIIPPHTQLRVWATYTDGTKRDVTKQTVFQSTNSGVLNVASSGEVTGQRWGGGAILGRYLGTIAASFVTLPQERKGVYPDLVPGNVIDNYVFGNLKALNVVPSAISGDTEFLRRVTLDTLGRLPTPEEIAAFQRDVAPDKRTKLIDVLLDKPEFADYRTMRLADLLRVNPRKLGNGNSLSERAAVLFYEWIWNNVRDNKPYDQFVRELITARGSTYQVGPANFFRIERQANDRMENIGQAFLGVRMSCARCHKHPFDRWTTDDYWNFAAFDQKVSSRGGRLEAEEIIGYNHGAQLRNESVTGRNRGKIAPATFLGDKQPAAEQPDMIVGLANWMTDSKNPFFARATINRLWSYYFGRGIIHPVDDMRATTPESVPGLLDALAKEFVDHKYDIKYVIRLILNSRTYQISSVPNVSNQQDDRFFSHFMSKAMPGQVLLDMIDQACGVQEQFGNFPERARAVQAAVPIGNGFLDAFGQSHREFLTEIDPKLEPNLVQTLTMINSPYVENKVDNGTTSRTIAKEAKTDEEVVQGCYLRVFSRSPTPIELTKSAGLIAKAKNRAEGTQDLMWALLTAREFYFNH